MLFAILLGTITSNMNIDGNCNNESNDAINNACYINIDEHGIVTITSDDTITNNRNRTRNRKKEHYYQHAPS